MEGRLITDSRDGVAVAPREGVETADMVTALVRAGLRVQEVAEERTLEAFYLSFGGRTGGGT